MAFEIGPYQVGDRLYQGRDLSVYRAIRLSDGFPLIAKIPNTNRPESAVSESCSGCNTPDIAAVRMQRNLTARVSRFSLRTPTGRVSQSIFRSCSFRSTNFCAWPYR